MRVGPFERQRVEREPAHLVELVRVEAQRSGSVARQHIPERNIGMPGRAAHGLCHRQKERLGEEKRRADPQLFRKLALDGRPRVLARLDMAAAGQPEAGLLMIHPQQARARPVEQREVGDQVLRRHVRLGDAAQRRARSDPRQGVRDMRLFEQIVWADGANEAGNCIAYVHQSDLLAAQRPGFSCRLAALANATVLGAEGDSKRKKRTISHAARRSAATFHALWSLPTRETALIRTVSRQPRMRHAVCQYGRNAWGAVPEQPVVSPQVDCST
jgi:hypothetical protein